MKACISNEPSGCSASFIVRCEMGTTIKMIILGEEMHYNIELQILLFIKELISTVGIVLGEYWDHSNGSWEDIFKMYVIKEQKRQ
jgi:hypothetical protein